MPEPKIIMESHSALLSYLERIESVVKALRQTTEARLTDPDHCKATFRELAQMGEKMKPLFGWLVIQLECQAVLEERDGT